MKKFIQFKINTTPQNNELISGLLWQFDLAGIVESDSGLILYVDPTKPISEDEIKKLLDAAKSEGLLIDYYLTKETIEDKNWNEEYERNVKVIEVTEKIVIKPSFKNYNSKKGQIVITIDPKMSFGTGEHETTKLVLTLLEKYVHKNCRVLDVGSGTGILAIASVLLGAESAIGIDNDEWCLLNGKENVSLNKLQDKVEIRLSELDNVIEKNFDLVLANINKHILLEIGELLSAKIKDTGKLILSGILENDEQDIIRHYKTLSMKQIDKHQMNEWLALVFQREI